MSDAAFLPLTWPATGLKPHAFASIFRMLSGDEKTDLDASILAKGIKQRIRIFQDQILDGRNRYLALIDNELFDPAADWRERPDLFEEFTGTEQEAFDLVWALNHERRHDTPQQRAMSAARRANMPQGFRSDLASPEQPSANLRPVSQAEAAAAEHVSERAVNSASRVIRKGTPELQQAVDENRVPLHVAEQLTDLPPEEQREIVEGDRDEVRTKVKARTTRRAPPAHAPDRDLFSSGNGPTTERVAALPMVHFARFAQSVLNLARGGKPVAAETLIELATQNEIVRLEAEGFVLTDEALAAMGTLAAGQPKVRTAEVRSPLPAAPKMGEPREISVGGLRDKAAARFTITINTSGEYCVSVAWRFPSSGGTEPPHAISRRYEDAVSHAAFLLTREFERIINSSDSVTTEKERAAARGGLHWFGNKLAHWGIVAADKLAVEEASPPPVELTREQRDAVIREVYGRDAAIDFAEIERRTGLTKDQAKKRASHLKLGNRDRQRAAVAAANKAHGPRGVVKRQQETRA